MEFINIEVSHMQHALRGMRNAMSGWDKSDTRTVIDDHLHTHDTVVGTSDRKRRRLRRLDLAVHLLLVQPRALPEIAQEMAGEVFPVPRRLMVLVGRHVRKEW